MPNFIQLAADDFQRADENPLSDSGKWTADQTGSFPTPVQLVSHQAEASVDVNVLCEDFFTGTSFPDDQYAEVVVGNYGGTMPLLRLIIRGNPSSKAQYFVTFVSDLLQIVYKDASGNVSTLLASSATIHAGDMIRFAAQGTTLTVYQNGVVIGSASDSNLSSGMPGIFLRADLALNDVTFSHFAAGQVSFIDDLSSSSVGDQLTSDRMEAIQPARVDRGHVFNGVVYGGTIHGLAADGSGTGRIVPTLDLTLRAGQANGVRAGAADITYAAANGDSVKFVVVRDSAGDMLARLVTKN